MSKSILFLQIHVMMIHVDPRRPLYDGYAQVLCTNGIQCCFINYRQRIQSEQMTGLIAFHWKSFYNYFMTRSSPHPETPGPCISAAKG
jgi:hypothetical protein